MKVRHTELISESSVKVTQIKSLNTLKDGEIQQLKEGHIKLAEDTEEKTAKYPKESRPIG